MGSAGVLAITSTSLWYATRGAGLACLLLFTASVVLGVLNVSRWSKPEWPRFAIQDLHRNVSLIALLLLAIHILTAELDTFAPVGWLAVVVPFASSYRPLWLGLGTVASDLFVAIVVTSLVRNRLGHRLWRTIHWAGYAAWPVAVLHGLGTGTDPKLGWVQAFTALCVAAVVVAVGWRLVHARPPVAGVRTGLSAAAVVALIAAGYWTYNGPLKPGWAKRAGTPRTLLAARSASPAASSPRSAPASGSTTPAGLPAVPFDAPIDGRLAQQGPDQTGQVTVTINARVAGSAPGSLLVVMRGQAAQGGVSLSSSSVTFGSVAAPSDYRGQVVALDGEQLVAVVRSATGTRLQLSASLNIDPSSGSVSGTLRVTAYAGQGSDGG